MEINELRRKFIIGEEELKEQLETLVTKTMKYCRLDNGGRVHFENKKLSTKDKLKVTFAARAVASQLDPGFSADQTAAELAQTTGIPIDQVRARCAELVAEHYVESPHRGVFRAIFGKIEGMLDSVTGSD